MTKYSMVLYIGLKSRATDHTSLSKNRIHVFERVRSLTSYSVNSISYLNNDNNDNVYFWVSRGILMGGDEFALSLPPKVT